MPYSTLPSNGALLLYCSLTFWNSLIQLLPVSSASGR